MVSAARPLAPEPYSHRFQFRRLTHIAGLLYFLLTAIVCTAGFRDPGYNWDVLGYMGAALAFEETDAVNIHDRVFAAARSRIPDEKFAELTVGAHDPLDRAYRRDMFVNPSHFVQQLPYYQVRPAYVALVYVLYRLGLDLVDAVTILSVAGFAGIALLLWVWLRRYLSPILAAPVAALLQLNTPMLELLRIAGPDPLSVLTLLIAVFVLVEYRRPFWSAAILMLSISVRSDNVILTLMITAMLAMTDRPIGLRMRDATILAGVVLAIYFVIHAHAGHYGWPTLFEHTFGSLVLNPAERTVAIPAHEYFAALGQGLRSLVESSLLLFGLVGLLAFVLPAPEADDRLLDRLLLVLAANVVVRYALFPVVWDRFLVVHYLLAAVILVIRTTGLLRQSSLTLTNPESSRTLSTRE